VPSLWVTIQLTAASEWNAKTLSNPSQLKVQFIVKPSGILSNPNLYFNFSGQVTGLNIVDGSYRTLSGYFNRDKKCFEVIAVWGDSDSMHLNLFICLISWVEVIFCCILWLLVFCLNISRKVLQRNLESGKNCFSG
jgi:hypothetical protein